MMQTEDKPLDLDLSISSEEKIKIYSKKVVWAFSVFFTSIFGGILLMQNLKEAGNKKAAYLILFYSVIFTVVTAVIVDSLKVNSSMLPIMGNMIGGAILSEYFFQKYFPNHESYEKKKIWKPLIISLLISAVLLLALLYSTGLI